MDRGRTNRIRRISCVALCLVLFIGCLTGSGTVDTAKAKTSTYWIHAYCEGSGVANSKKLIVKADVKKKKIYLKGIGYKTKSSKFTTAKKYKKKYSNKAIKVASGLKYTDEDVYAMGYDYFTFEQAFGLSNTVYGPLVSIKVVGGKVKLIRCSS